MRCPWRRWRPPLVTGGGLPARRHPESLARELPGRDEEWLSGLCGELWPEEEYEQIIRDTRPGGQA